MARSNLCRLLFDSSTPKFPVPYARSEPVTRSVGNSLSRLISSSIQPEQPQSQETSKKEEGDAIKQNPGIENGKNQQEDEDEDGVHVNKETGEIGGPTGPEPTRYGDWERSGRCSDF